MIKAAECALVSMDSTIKSNLTVAPPIDVMIYEKGGLVVKTHQVLADDDPYWNEIRGMWADGLEGRFAILPDPNW